LGRTGVGDVQIPKVPKNLAYPAGPARILVTNSTDRMLWYDGFSTHTSSSDLDGSSGGVSQT